MLGHREVDDMIDTILCPRRPEDPEELQKYVRKDNTARMTIGLTLSDAMLGKISHTVTALEMLQAMLEVTGVRLVRD